MFGGSAARRPYFPVTCGPVALRPPLSKGLPLSAPRYGVVRRSLSVGSKTRPILGLPNLQRGHPAAVTAISKEFPFVCHML